jgi:hypothetical protein
MEYKKFWKVLNTETNQYYVEDGKYGALEEGTRFTWDEVIELLKYDLKNNHIIDIMRS